MSAIVLHKKNFHLTQVFPVFNDEAQKLAEKAYFNRVRIGNLVEEIKDPSIPMDEEYAIQVNDGWKFVTKKDFVDSIIQHKGYSVWELSSPISIFIEQISLVETEADAFKRYHHTAKMYNDGVNGPSFIPEKNIKQYLADLIEYYETKIKCLKNDLKSLE